MRLAPQPQGPSLLEPRSLPPVVKPRLVHDLHFHLAVDPFDLAQHLVVWSEDFLFFMFRCHGHQVAQRDHTAIGPKGGFEDVRSGT